MAPDDQPGNRGSKLRCLVAWMPLPVEIVEEKFSVVDKEEDDNAFEKQTRGETFPTVETDYSHPNVAKMVQEWETVNGMVGTMGSKSKDKNESVLDSGIFALDIVDEESEEWNLPGEVLDEPDALHRIREGSVSGCGLPSVQARKGRTADRARVYAGAERPHQRPRNDRKRRNDAAAVRSITSEFPSHKTSQDHEERPGEECSTVCSSGSGTALQNQNAIHSVNIKIVGSKVWCDLREISTLPNNWSFNLVLENAEIICVGQEAIERMVNKDKVTHTPDGQDTHGCAELDSKDTQREDELSAEEDTGAITPGLESHGAGGSGLSLGRLLEAVVHAPWEAQESETVIGNSPGHSECSLHTPSFGKDWAEVGSDCSNTSGAGYAEDGSINGREVLEGWMRQGRALAEDGVDEAQRCVFTELQNKEELKDDGAMGAVGSGAEQRLTESVAADKENVEVMGAVSSGVEQRLTESMAVSYEQEKVMGAISSGAEQRLIESMAKEDTTRATSESGALEGVESVDDGSGDLSYTNSSTGLCGDRISGRGRPVGGLSVESFLEKGRDTPTQLHSNPMPKTTQSHYSVTRLDASIPNGLLKYNNGRGKSVHRTLGHS